MKLSLPTRRFIAQEEEKIIKRSLSGSGKIYVKKNAQVSPEDILGESEMSVGFRCVSVAHTLGVNPKKISKYLLKKKGDHVFLGETLARKTALFGRFKNELKSPASGTIVGIDENGDINIEFRRETQKLVSGVWGRVEDIHGDKTVEIKTQLSEVRGVCGAGRIREGILKILCSRQDFLLPRAIDSQMSGSIIFGGALVSREALSRAVAVGVSGIITGGMHARDFWEAGGAHESAYWTSSDVGLTVIILQGFGLVAPSQEVFDFLKVNEGKFAVVDGDSATITIPLREVEAVKQVVYDDQKELEIGDRVRILDLNHFGEFGKVSEITKGQKKVFTHETTLIKVETSHGTIDIPYQNLEILI